MVSPPLWAQHGSSHCRALETVGGYHAQELPQRAGHQRLFSRCAWPFTSWPPWLAPPIKYMPVCWIHVYLELRGLQVTEQGSRGSFYFSHLRQLAAGNSPTHVRTECPPAVQDKHNPAKRSSQQPEAPMFEAVKRHSVSTRGRVLGDYVLYRPPERGQGRHA